MELYAITAFDWNFGIGLRNTIPWRLSKDLNNFKEVTRNEFVIMGRKTYESLGKWKPLPDRWNIILSRNKGYEPEGANEKTVVVFSLKEAILLAMKLGYTKAFIAGGGEIYRMAFEQKEFPVTKIIATLVQAESVSDTFFPPIHNIWNPVYVKPILHSGDVDSKNWFRFSIVEYTPDMHNLLTD